MQVVFNHGIFCYDLLVFVDIFFVSILVRHRCSNYQSVKDVKKELWKAAEFAQLKAHENYTLSFVNQKMEQEQCTDESQRICDLCMFTPLLKIQEKKAECTEASDFAKSVDELIGTVKESRELGAAIGPELKDYWTKMATRCQEVIEERNSFSWDERVRYAAPPDLEGLGTTTPAGQGEFLVSVWISIPGQPSEQFQVSALATDTAVNVIEKIQHFVCFNERQSLDDFILKVCGLEEYLIGCHPLYQYSYIRRSLTRHKVPILVLMPKSVVLLPDQPEQFMAPAISKDRSAWKRSGSPMKDTWEIKDNLRIRVVNACRLVVHRDAMVEARVAVYFGVSLLCAPRSTRPVRPEARCSASVWSWEEGIELGVSVSDLPCGARLCLELHAVDSADMQGNEGRSVPLAWVNQPLFDYKKHLRTGTSTLSCWPFDPEDPSNENLRYGHHGTVMLNPNLKDAPSIMIQYPEYAEGIPAYPDETKILELGRSMSTPVDLPLPTSTEIVELNSIISRVWVTELNADEKELIWRFRQVQRDIYEIVVVPLNLPAITELLGNTKGYSHICGAYGKMTYFLDKPSFLSVVLNSVKWNIHENVAMMHCALSIWKLVPPLEALELLDYAYQDPQVREFAVKSIAEFSDTELLQYLLQLCQALKYESHLDCPLGRLLLERAWRNKRIGHFLFWHLRSEMESPEVNVRFALMLEAYLRGSPNHVAELHKQMCAMEKMIKISQLLHSKQFKNNVDRDSAYQSMMNMLLQESFQKALSGMTNPLNPKQRLGEFRAKDSAFFDSKGRPLLLVYQNDECLDEHKSTAIIFKFVNDLHQDMLLLQIITIMEKLWVNSGLDIRVLPYGCVATGLNTGFIEVVRKADTIERIYEKYRTSHSTRDRKVHVLYQWLKDHNPTEKSLQGAMEAFCRSCAGYSVATYVLGIGDRHSDNIMITEDGQLFHIDFGHFLGNFKEMFGLRRERVPFVLPQDFEIIIEKHFGFERFAKLCEDAYIILRQNAYQYIKLLALMVQTGLPELRSISDLDYVHDALVLETSERNRCLGVFVVKSPFASTLEKPAWPRDELTFIVPVTSELRSSKISALFSVLYQHVMITFRYYITSNLTETNESDEIQNEGTGDYFCHYYSGY
ncbi:hypothetical protein EMCRGX_G017097 [Ephydatia muelleri]